MAIARKNVGPAVATAEKVSIAGWANSLSPTTQLKFGSAYIPELLFQRWKFFFYFENT